MPAPSKGIARASSTETRFGFVPPKTIGSKKLIATKRALCDHTELEFYYIWTEGRGSHGICEGVCLNCKKVMHYFGSTTKRELSYMQKVMDGSIPGRYTIYNE